MFERFTDRARKVLMLANQEAQRFNHEYVGVEHLLLGLVKEGSGVAANVLKNLGVDLPKLRDAVCRHVKPGPDFVTMGKLPQTPRAKKALECACKESLALQHNYVGTEHILLGLIGETEGVAAVALQELGVKYTEVRDGVLHLLGAADVPLVENRIAESFQAACESVHAAVRAGVIPPTESTESEYVTSRVFQVKVQERLDMDPFIDHAHNRARVAFDVLMADRNRDGDKAIVEAARACLLAYLKDE